MSEFTEINWRVYEEDIVSRLGGNTYRDYPVILRDTPVTGSVMYEAAAEATVVDPEAMPDPYEWLYDTVRTQATRNGMVRQGLIVSRLGRFVASHMKYSRSRVQRLIAETAKNEGYESVPNGYLINAGVFIANKVGLCRHHVLASGYVAERFASEGYIPSVSMSVDSNWARHKDKPKGSGHAWFRMVTQPGRADHIHIIDPAQRSYGDLNSLYDPAFDGPD